MKSVNMEPLTILLVDDDEIERLKFKKSCSMARDSYIVVEAKNGEEALTILRENPKRFCLIVSDINMPKMDGFQFLIEIKKDSTLNTIPIVVMSTSKNQVDIDKCNEIGIDKYYSKPIKYLDYKDKVISLLNSWDKN